MKNKIKITDPDVKKLDALMRRKNISLETVARAIDVVTVHGVRKWIKKGAIPRPPLKKALREFLTAKEAGIK